jgi:hypothetical protein
MKGFFMTAIDDDLYANMRTNELVDLVKSQINVLIDWASADFEASLDNQAKSDASSDKQRVRNLRKILGLIEDSYK